MLHWDYECIVITVSHWNLQAPNHVLDCWPTPSSEVTLCIYYLINIIMSASQICTAILPKKSSSTWHTQWHYNHNTTTDAHALLLDRNKLYRLTKMIHQQSILFLRGSSTQSVSNNDNPAILSMQQQIDLFIISSYNNS